MDFELTTDQAALRDGVRKMLAGRFPMDVVRALEASGGVDLDRWRELADAGVFSLRRAETDGGAGLGFTEAVLVFEELGRALVPGPLIASHLCAGRYAQVSDGAVVTIVTRDPAPVTLVEHLDAADAIVVLDAEGVWTLGPEDVTGEALPRPLDPLTPVHLVHGLPSGVQVGDRADAARLRVEGAVLAAAMLAGIAGEVTERAVAYAGERVQFDRPIGSFQAVKHILADMFTRAEVARAAADAAGVTLDDPSAGDAARAAAGAKVVAAEAAVLNAKSCIQIHGGMGFTWEVDAHLFLKRAWVLETAFGSSDEHCEALAQLL